MAATFDIVNIIIDTETVWNQQNMNHLYDKMSYNYLWFQVNKQNMAQSTQEHMIYKWSKTKTRKLSWLNISSCQL